MGDEIRLMLAGATAGAVTKTLTAPLERAKILLQVQRGANPLYRGAWGTLRRVVAEEGTLALWKVSGDVAEAICPFTTLPCRATGPTCYASSQTMGSSSLSTT